MSDRQTDHQPDEKVFPDKIWNPMFINVLVVNVAMSMGQFMMNALIPLYSHSLGATSTVVGIITGLFTVTALAVKPFSGPSVDSFSKKKILIFGCSISLSAFILYSLSSSLTALVIARLIHGIGMGFTAVSALSMASDALPQNKLGQGIGYFSLGQAMATAIGPLLGLTLLSYVGFHNTFLIAAGILAMAILLITFMKAPVHVHKKLVISLNRMFAKEALIPTCLQLFLTMAYTSVGSFLVLYAQNERGVANIGLWFTLNAICMFISRPTMGKLADKLGFHKVLLPSYMIFILSLFTISMATNIWIFLLSAVLNAFGFGVAMPTHQAFCMKFVAPERRGVGVSTMFIGVDIGFMTGPVLAGALVAWVGYSNMYRIMIIPVLLTITVFITMRKKIKEVSTKTD